MENKSVELLMPKLLRPEGTLSVHKLCSCLQTLLMFMHRFRILFADDWVGALLHISCCRLHPSQGLKMLILGLRLSGRGTGSMDTISKHEAATLKAVSFMATVAKQVFLVTDPAAAEMFETVYAETFGFNSCLRLHIPVLGAF
uniref:Uncharacterized protein n=1 Tax=Physcomitrium patens TaxID=3218 RepID=A0A2K1IWR1_PHYPA|nr:hypothetical protein PHYPA_023529 [Physcomitrium patens]